MKPTLNGGFWFDFRVWRITLDHSGRPGFWLSKIGAGWYWLQLWTWHAEVCSLSRYASPEDPLYAELEYLRSFQRADALVKEVR